VTASKVAIVMGSTSDQATMHLAAETLDGLGVEYETRVLSAHRTPEALREWVESLPGRGVRVVICGAGGAANLARAVAALTTRPVIGVSLVAPTRRSRRPPLPATRCWSGWSIPRHRPAPPRLAGC